RPLAHSVDPLIDRLYLACPRAQPRAHACPSLERYINKVLAQSVRRRHIEAVQPRIDMAMTRNGSFSLTPTRPRLDGGPARLAARPRILALLLIGPWAA